MNNFRQCALCIGTSVLILLVSGCSDVFDTPEDSKETQIKKSFCENVRYVPNSRISRIYTTKKAIEMANLKKVTKGSGRYTQISPKVIDQVY